MLSLLVALIACGLWTRLNSTSRSAFEGLGAQVTTIPVRLPWFVPSLLRRWIPDEVVTVTYQSAPLPSGLLRRIAQLRGLRSLRLNGTDLDDAGLAKLEGLTTLGELNLDGTRITDRGLKRLSRLRNLHYLSIHRTAVTDAGLAELERLTGRTGFRDTAVLALLREALPWPRWRVELLSDEDQFDSLRLDPLDDMQELIPLGCVSHFMRLPRLKKLSLDRVSPETVAALAPLPMLRSLSLRADQAVLSNLEKLNRLEELRLHGSDITDESLGHLANLNLRVLAISRCRIQEAGLAKIIRIPRLEELEIEFHLPTPPPRGGLAEEDSVRWQARCRHLTSILPSFQSAKNLTSLKLSFAPLDDAGCAELARLETLAILDLGGCGGVTDAGAAELRSLPLVSLNLGGTAVTGELLERLGRIPTLRRLAIGLPLSTISGELKAFRAINPDCEVVESMYASP